MASNSDSPQFRPHKDHKDHLHEPPKPGEPTGAGHKLHAEAAEAWRHLAEKARKTPLNVGENQKYKVVEGDCLSDVAARRLRTDHEKVDGRSIFKEEQRLRKLNDKQYASLDSKGKKGELLGKGWELQIYDSTHTKPKDSGAPKVETPKVEAPKIETPKVETPKAPPPEAVPPLPPRPVEGPAAKLPAEKPAPLPVPRPEHLEAPPKPPLRHDGPGSEEHERQHPVKRRHEDDQGGPHRHRRDRHHHGRRHQPHEEGAPETPPNQGAPEEGPSQNPERIRPGHRQKPGQRPDAPADERPDSRPDSSLPGSPGSKLERHKFYTHQTDAFSCSAVAMAMMHSNQVTGRPPTPGEVQHFKQVAGTTQHGYRGSLADMAAQCRSQGLNAKPYEYGRFNQQGMSDLDRELAAGHSAVARIVNPHTGNPHYIFIAGKNSNGEYVIGDPDRKNNAARGHDRPITREHLYGMMSGRNGFVAGWS